MCSTYSWPTTEFPDGFSFSDDERATAPKFSLFSSIWFNPAKSTTQKFSSCDLFFSFLTGCLFQLVGIYTHTHTLENNNNNNLGKRGDCDEVFGKRPHALSCSRRTELNAKETWKKLSHESKQLFQHCGCVGEKRREKQLDLSFVGFGAKSGERESFFLNDVLCTNRVAVTVGN